MALVPDVSAPRVLLLAAEPGSARLLRGLLAALPAPAPLVLDDVGAAASCTLCLLGLGAGDPAFTDRLARLRQAAPGLRIAGVLGAQAGTVDAVTVARALAGGMDTVLVAEDLSVTRLTALLEQSGAPAIAGTVADPAAGGSGSGSWRIDLVAQTAGFDAATLAALGYPPGQTGTTIGDWKALIHPDDTDRLVQDVHQVLNGSAPPYPVGYRIRQASGSWLAVSSGDIRVELAADRTPRAISGQFFTAEPAATSLQPPAASPSLPAQATATEATNPRLARGVQDQLVHDLARSLPLTSLLVDERGRVLRCIAVGNGRFGATAEALEDRTLDELLGADAAAQVNEQLSRTLNTGRICSTVYRIGREGEPAWIECHTAVLRTRPGLPPQAILSIQDVSGRMDQIRSAQSARDQLREALRQFPLPLAIKDVDGRYQAANAGFEDLYGIDAALLLGKNDHEIFPDALADELLEAQRITLEAGRAFSEHRVAGQGERRQPHICFHFPVRDADGRIASTGSVWIAVAELPAMPETPPPSTLQRGIERALAGDKLTDAAASVISSVEDTLAERGDYIGVLHQLERLVETSMHAQALLHQVAGQPEAPAAGHAVMLSPLLEDIVELEKILLPAGARLDTDVAPDLPPALCDAVSFHRVLLRAIRQARRSLADDGTLLVRLRRAGIDAVNCSACAAPLDAGFLELMIAPRQEIPAFPRAVEAVAAAEHDAELAGDLAEIQALVHAQGGHVRFDDTTGSAPLRLYFRAPDLVTDVESTPSRSTVARFPLERVNPHKGGS